MREANNIKALATLNIDYLGMIFYPKSKRYITNSPKVEMSKSTKKVGVFVDEELEKVKAIALEFGLKTIQLHGHESPDYCKKLQNSKLSIIKVFHVDEQFNFEQTKAYEKVCDYFLFDTKGKQLGGNGIRFNWRCLDNYKGTIPFFLSGGIAPEHAKALEEFEHPLLYGIDINSKFEDAPALKNIPKIQLFLNQLS
ncbi:MAG: phosphoribosylanthranilate isomerase [Aureispira sp.]|nr:phosphoribosylanthranilate isomerase [Aureispira sp.]